MDLITIVLDTTGRHRFYDVDGREIIGLRSALRCLSLNQTMDLANAGFLEATIGIYAKVGAPPKEPLPTVVGPVRAIRLDDTAVSREVAGT